MFFRILKTTWAINTIHLDNLRSVKELFKYILLGFTHLPFSLTTSFFRISSIVIILSYINQYGFMSIIAFWLTTLVILVKYSNESFEKAKNNSTWLTSFIGLFVPAYYLPRITKDVSGQNDVLIRQRKIYQFQNMAALICYLPSLIACLVLTNTPCNRNLCYNYQIKGYRMILNNYEFNSIICIIIAQGLISTMLAWDQRFSSIISCCHSGERKKNVITVEEESGHNEAHVNSTINQDKNSKFSCLKRSAFSLKHVLLLLLSILPFICGTLSIWAGQEEEIDAYIYSGLNKTSYLNATLISSKNCTKIGPAVLRPYVLPPGEKPAPSEIVAFTMNLAWTESEHDIESRLSAAQAVIIYEEIGYERPSSPLPHKIVNVFTNQGKWRVVRVKHWPEKDPKSWKQATISFEKDLNGIPT